MEPAARAGRRAVVEFPEHVDESNAGQIRARLLAVDNGAAVVIADMSATASCDHAGVDTVSLACQQAAIRRAELRLVATAPAVRWLLIMLANWRAAAMSGYRPGELAGQLVACAGRAAGRAPPGPGPPMRSSRRPGRWPTGPG